MQAYFRNKRTGEIKQVEYDSGEHRELLTQVGPDGHSVWEQTSYPNAAEIKDRAAYGELRPEDLGHDDQDALRQTEAVLSARGVGPDPAPHQNLTPGEIEAGLTPEQKAEDLRDMFGDRNADVETVAGLYDSAADRIADERRERDATQQAAGLRARSGGSDEREDVPVANAGSSSRRGKKAADKPAETAS